MKASRWWKVSSVTQFYLNNISQNKGLLSVKGDASAGMQWAGLVLSPFPTCQVFWSQFHLPQSVKTRYPQRDCSMSWESRSLRGRQWENTVPELELFCFSVSIISVPQYFGFPPKYLVYFHFYQETPSCSSLVKHNLFQPRGTESSLSVKLKYHVMVFSHGKTPYKRTAWSHISPDFIHRVIHRAERVRLQDH